MKYVTPDEYTRLVQCGYCKSLVLPDGIPAEELYGISDSFDPIQLPVLTITKRIQCPNCGTFIVIGKQSGEISREESMRAQGY